MSEPKRIAWMAVGCSMFKEMCGDRVLSFLKMKDLLDCRFSDTEVRLDTFAEWMEEAYKAIHKGLLLPANSKVVGVSLSYYFSSNQVALQIECEDFKETPEGSTMPQVEASYYVVKDLLGKTTRHFGCWLSGAALVNDYKVPTAVPLDRCSEELGHFAAPGDNLCYCGKVAKSLDSVWYLQENAPWWDSAYSSTSNNPTAEDAQQIANAVADQVSEAAPRANNEQLRAASTFYPNGGIMATWQPDPDDIKMYQKNAAELSDKCEAKFSFSGERCVLTKSHEGCHIAPSDFQFWTEELTHVTPPEAAKAPEVKSSNRGYEFL